MPRLISPPCATIASVEWLNGPNSRNSGSNTSVDGTEQTFDAYGDVVAVRIDFDPVRDRRARRERGMLLALQGGNALRLTYLDRDMPLPAEAGVDVPASTRWRDLPRLNWSNGLPWSNGKGWKTSAPVVEVAASSTFDTGIVSLANTFWGHSLGMGDHLGFFPFHFGIYTVTEVLDNGRYRVWPRLRKALTTSDYATLHPVVVVRPAGKQDATWRRARHPGLMTDAGITCVEVPDYYVRDYYEG